MGGKNRYPQIEEDRIVLQIYPNIPLTEELMEAQFRASNRQGHFKLRISRKPIQSKETSPSTELFFFFLCFNFITGLYSAKNIAKNSSACTRHCMA